MGGQIKNGELERRLVKTAIVSEICRDFPFKRKLAMTPHISDPFKRSTYLRTSESPPPAPDGPIRLAPGVTVNLWKGWRLTGRQKGGGGTSRALFL